MYMRCLIKSRLYKSRHSTYFCAPNLLPIYKYTYIFISVNFFFFQKLLLDVTVSSLNDNSHISSLFRVNSMDLYENRYSSIEEVMKLLLKHLTNSTVSKMC